MKKNLIWVVACLGIIAVAIGSGLLIKLAFNSKDSVAKESDGTITVEETDNEIIDNEITVKQKFYGGWINGKKQFSIRDLESNVAPSTMLVFASSELNHLKDTPYHPTNMFADTNVNLMLIGNGYNQCLSMSTYLGALEPQVKNRKVALLLSPSWFYKKGVTKQYYTMRFSEGTYIAFMENKNISNEIKSYVAYRSESLINDADLLEKVKRYNDIFINKNDSAKNEKFLSERKKTIDEYTHKALMEELNQTEYKNLPNKVFQADSDDEPDWEGLVNKAIKEDENRRNNQFFVDDSRWAEKYEAIAATLKNKQSKSSFKESPEYEDLKCFLNICKENDIEPLLVMEPMNGYWYDYSDFKAEKRQQFVDNINEIAKEYDCKAVSYQDKEYEKYFLLDSVHLAGEGWTLINKELYDFYKN